MTTKNESSAAAPERTPARASLAMLIARRDAASANVEDKETAQRRLRVVGEASQAIASQLEAEKARDAERLKDYALNGGRVPVLAGEQRAQLYARLAEAEARAEGAKPAMVLVEQQLTKARESLRQATVAVEAAVTPILGEELREISREIEALNERLIPLHMRLAGLKSWAILAAARQATETGRQPFQAIVTAAIEAMRVGRVSDQTPTGRTEETVWGSLTRRLPMDADAQAVCQVEAA